MNWSMSHSGDPVALSEVDQIAVVDQIDNVLSAIKERK